MNTVTLPEQLTEKKQGKLTVLPATLLVLAKLFYVGEC